MNHKRTLPIVKQIKTFFKKNKSQTLFILLGFLTILVVGNITPSLFLTEKTASKQIITPTPTTVLPTPTDVTTPTKQPYVPTIPQNTPTPTTPTYKYILWKSADEIRLTVPTQTGFAISATLRDEKMNIVTNQSDFTYKWTIDNPSLVKEKAQPFSGCTQGIQEPCPQDHFTFAASASGQTVIRVTVSKDDQTVAATTFPLIIEEIK